MSRQTLHSGKLRRRKHHVGYKRHKQKSHHLRHGKDADVRAKNTSIGKNTEFDIFYDNEKYAHVIIKVPGTHNVYNALAAAAASIALGIPREAVETGLGGFGGACRRLEHKGSYGGAEIYDDYAHHPGELRALYQAVSVMGFERTICIFQPHTYSRLKLFSMILHRCSGALMLCCWLIFMRRKRTQWAYPQGTWLK